MSFKYEFGFIGAGNMAEGIIAAAVKDQLYSPKEIVISDPIAERRQFCAGQFGVMLAESNAELVSQARRVVFAVKPQTFPEVARELVHLVTADHLLISIMAGVSTTRVAAAFSGTRARVVRVMPNLPIQVGAGMAGIFANDNAGEEDLDDVRTLFNAGGSSVVVKDEGLMDAVTAVAGSGPAYFYYFVESIVAGGVACGLREEDALALAKNTCLGAARMMLERPEPPAELRRRVTSKGGTTQAALELMERSEVGPAIRDAVQAAFKRGRELGS